MNEIVGITENNGRVQYVRPEFVRVIRELNFPKGDENEGRFTQIIMAGEIFVEVECPIEEVRSLLKLSTPQEIYEAIRKQVKSQVEFERRQADKYER